VFDLIIVFIVARFSARLYNILAFIINIVTIKLIQRFSLTEYPRQELIVDIYVGMAQ